MWDGDSVIFSIMLKLSLVTRTCLQLTEEQQGWESDFGIKPFIVAMQN